MSARSSLVALALASWTMGCACAERSFSIEAGASSLVACAQLASTAQDRARGLIGRASLRDGEALWLEWPTSVEACIHNAGVSFSIDAVFVGADGVVLALERAIAADDPTVRCHAGVRHVIELRAGAAQAASVGARVRW